MTKVVPLVGFKAQAKQEEVPTALLLAPEPIQDRKRLDDAKRQHSAPTGAGVGIEQISELVA